jgi:hypothetical protein
MDIFKEFKIDALKINVCVQLAESDINADDFYFCIKMIHLLSQVSRLLANHFPHPNHIQITHFNRHVRL